MKRRASALLFGVVLLVTGCADSPFSPETFGVKPQLARDRYADDGTITIQQDQPPFVTVVRRRTPLLEALVVEQLIGPEGGQIELADVGFKVTFAAGAVSVPTWITVSAPAGDLVGYHFQPSGLQFSAKVSLKQNLKYTNAKRRDPLTGAYFEGELNEFEEALKLIPVVINMGIIKFEVEHFSGYVIATH